MSQSVTMLDTASVQEQQPLWTWQELKTPPFRHSEDSKVQYSCSIILCLPQKSHAQGSRTLAAINQSSPNPWSHSLNHTHSLISHPHSGTHLSTMATHTHASIISMSLSFLMLPTYQLTLLIMVLVDYNCTFLYLGDLPLLSLGEASL